MVLAFYENQPLEIKTIDAPQRPLPMILLQPVFLLAASAGAVAYAVMSLIMTATPVSMHQIDHFNLSDTTWVIQSHVMAMFLPSLFSGVLIDRIGPIRVILLGLVLMFVCLGIA